ncbi:MAG: lysozyme [Stenotrophomonas sp.]
MAADTSPPQNGTGRGAVVLGSTILLGFLALWESSSNTRLTVYPDKLAGGLPTVCDGITRHITTTPIVVGEKWTAEKCANETRMAVVKVQNQLLRCFKVTPPQGVFDAATSHAWNVGAANTCSSGAMQAWNRGDWMLGCRRLAFSDAGKPVWSYVKTGRVLSNGKPEMKFVQGLANRRGAERAICEGRA